MQRKETTRGKVLYYFSGACAIASWVIPLVITPKVAARMGMGPVLWLLGAAFLFFIIGGIFHRRSFLEQQ